MHIPAGYGADDEARTRYLHLGKVALYQMSYVRKRNDDYYTAGFDKCQGFFSSFFLFPRLCRKKRDGASRKFAPPRPFLGACAKYSHITLQTKKSDIIVKNGGEFLFW